MRVILVTSDPPDPFRNPAERWTYALVKGLVERGHDVECFCIAERSEYVERAQRLLGNLSPFLHIYSLPEKRTCSMVWSKLRTLRRPFVDAWIPEEMRDGVSEACARGYDILHVEHLQGFGYLGVGLPRSLVSVHMLNLIDLRGSGFRSWKFFKTKALYWRVEIELLWRYRHVRVLTDRLARAVKRINPTAHIYKVPIAIDPAVYPMIGSNGSEKVVGLIAGMRWETSHRATIRLLTRIWPRIRQKVPDARLLVAGWDARRVLKQFLQEPGVTILENITDASEFFRHCTVLAYPLPFGGGLKGKILESMAYGVPVVTTTEGIAGVEAQSGVHAFIEDSDELFAERVGELLGAPALRRQMAEAARVLVEEKYSPAPVVSQIEGVYQQVAKT